MQKTVGIIGGMGPLATVDLMTKIINFTEAKEDQQHIHIIADNYPQIPDRTAAIVGGNDDPTPFMIESAQRLERAGADILIMACNTAHHFYDGLKKSIKTPVLHMPKETVQFVERKKLSKVGLLATDGTISTNIYQSYCQKNNIDIIIPDSKQQQLVMEGIYAIKGGLLKKGSLFLSTVAKSLEMRGAEAIIAGCTEVPIVLKSTRDFTIIDPTEIAAKRLVQIAKDSSDYTIGV